MKKFITILLTLTLALSLAACGGREGDFDEKVPDLNQYYEDFMATLGADNTPAMMDLEGEFLEAYYPGLGEYGAKQSVLKAAAITSVPYEFALVELEKESDAKAVADLFQARIDSQVQGGAFYPETIESWKKAQVLTKGRVVALISAGGEQEAAVSAFEKLFS